MEEQLVSFETAKILMNLNAHKDKDLRSATKKSYIIHRPTGELLQFIAPPQAILQKWLREKYNIHIMIDRLDRQLATKTIGYTYILFDYIGADEPNETIFKTYEEALEQALQEALNLI